LRFRFADRVEENEGDECGEGTAQKSLPLDGVSQGFDDLGGEAERGDEGQQPLDDARLPLVQ
jgi:hypothetical protein